MKNKHSGIVLANPNAEPAAGKERTHRPVDETAKPMSPGQRAAYRHLLGKLRAGR